MARLLRALPALVALALAPIAVCLAASTTFTFMSAVAQRYDCLPPRVDESSPQLLTFQLQHPPEGQVFMGVVVTVHINGLGATAWLPTDYSLLQGTRPVQPIGVLFDKGCFFPTAGVTFHRPTATTTGVAASSATGTATIFYAVPKDATNLVFKTGGHDTSLVLPATLSNIDQRNFYSVKITGARVVDTVQYKPKPRATPVVYSNKDGKILLVNADVLAKAPEAGGGWSVHWCWFNVAWGDGKTAPCLGTYDQKKELLDSTNPAVGNRAILAESTMPTKPKSVVLCFPIAPDARDFSLTILGYEMDKGHVPD